MKQNLLARFRSFNKWYRKCIYVQQCAPSTWQIRTLYSNLQV